MNELKLKIGDKVLITNGLPTEDKIGTVTKITPTGRTKLDIYTDYQFDRYGRQMGNRDIWSRSKSIRIPDKEDYNRVHKNEIIGHIYSKIKQLNIQNLYDTNISTLEILDDCLGLIGESKEPEYIKSNADDSKVMIMEYNNKELNEIRKAGYNHGYDVGYNKGIESVESEVSKLLNESLEESAKNSNMAAAGYDEGWYAGEMNAYEKVFNFIEKLKESKEQTKEQSFRKNNKEIER